MFKNLKKKLTIKQEVAIAKVVKILNDNKLTIKVEQFLIVPLEVEDEVKEDNSE